MACLSVGRLAAASAVRRCRTTTPNERTKPSDDALTEPTEDHVDVDSATAAHRGEPSVPLAGVGGSAAQKPVGIIAGAGLTDHDQPVEGGRAEAEDEADEAAEHGGGQEREGTSFGS